jgi:HEAT repeats
MAGESPARAHAQFAAARRWSTSGPIPLVLMLVPIGAWSDTPRPEPSAEEIGRLVNQLGDDNFRTREEASKELGKLGKSALALPMIENATDSSDPEVRSRAWRLIDHWASRGDMAALLFQLSSGAPPVKAGAADSLGKLEGKAQVALPILLQASNDATEIVRCSAQEAVKKIQATLPVKLEVKGGCETVDLDTPLVFRIEVTNQGTAAVTQIRLKVEVPEQLGVTAIEGPIQHKRDGNRIAGEPMVLETNETRFMEIQVKAKALGSVRLRVELTADGLNAPIVGEACTSINPPAPTGK